MRGLLKVSLLAVAASAMTSGFVISAGTAHAQQRYHLMNPTADKIRARWNTAPSRYVAPARPAPAYKPVRRMVRGYRSTAPYAGQNQVSVVRGDTLYSLSRRYGTTVEALMAANRMQSTMLRVGQVLVLPTR